jgi:hypothetical protein
LHSLLCKNYQAFLQTRPEIIDSDHPEEGEDSENLQHIPHKYVAALLFPKKAKYPQLIWLKCFIDHDEGWLYMVCTEAIMEYAGNPRPIYQIQNGQEIQTWMTDAFNGKPLNKCVKNLTIGYGTPKDRERKGHPAYWFDNIIVLDSSPTTASLRESEFEDIGETHEFHDVTLSDLRYAFDFFTKHDRIFESDKENPYYIRHRGQWRKAVKMYCNGDVKYDGKKKYQQVDVKLGHEIFFEHHGISSITKELGFPLRVLAVPVDEGWRLKWHERRLPDKPPYCDPFQHVEVFNLMLEVDMHHETYATADAKWEYLTGSNVFLVMRDNYKDLMANQLEAVISYSAECLKRKLNALNPRESDWFNSAGKEDDEYDSDIEMPRKMKLKRVAFQNEYLSGLAFDRFFNKLKVAKMEEESKAGGEKTWKFTSSPQPQPATNPETMIKDEEVVLKMEEIDINMEDVEEATEKAMRDQDFCEGERSPKRPRLE